MGLTMLLFEGHALERFFFTAGHKYIGHGVRVIVLVLSNFVLL